MDSAEFDGFASEYDQLLRKTLSVTGEDPEFFHEYKVRELARMAGALHLQVERILDFGSGVGNSTPFFRRYFPSAQLTSADVSARSLEVAEERFPGVATSLQIQGDRLPLADNSCDLAFSACVFHHIDHGEHVHWLSELLRVTRPGGMLGIFEHNPLNPLTVNAVHHCPFDANAHLIRSKRFVERYRRSGWTDPKVRYHLFFPRLLSGLRALEPYLAGIPFGGQYSITAVKRGSAGNLTDGPEEPSAE
ncbi:MAG: class I SAM-dependent methyltransferase [Acidobacteriota bacterium]